MPCGKKTRVALQRDITVNTNVFERWRHIRASEHLKTDIDVALFLIELYDRQRAGCSRCHTPLHYICTQCGHTILSKVPTPNGPVREGRESRVLYSQSQTKAATPAVMQVTQCQVGATYGNRLFTSFVKIQRCNGITDVSDSGSRIRDTAQKERLCLQSKTEDMTDVKADTDGEHECDGTFNDTGHDTSDDACHDAFHEAGPDTCYKAHVEENAEMVTGTAGAVDVSKDISISMPTVTVSDEMLDISDSLSGDATNRNRPPDKVTDTEKSDAAGQKKIRCKDRPNKRRKKLTAARGKFRCVGVSGKLSHSITGEREENGNKPRRKRRKEEVQCRKCYKSFSTRLLRKMHMQSHRTVRRRYVCDRCGEVFPTSGKDGLRGHKKKHPAVLPFQCSKCHLTVLTQTWLDMHQLIHRDLPQCDQCSQTFRTGKILQNHIMKQVCQQSHVCEQCGQVFEQRSQLKKHLFKKHKDLAAVKEGRTFICHVCGHLFMCRSDLAAHSVTHSADRPFPCDTCGMSFKGRTSLYIHQLKHKDKTFVCDQCPQAYPSLYELKKHGICHSTYRPFTCEECGKSFKRRSNYRNHKLTHQAREYQCQHCPLACVTKYDLTNHMRIHTGDKPYVCTVCQASFSRVDYLKKHKATHTGPTPYTCSMCGVGYRHNNSLQRHVKTCTQTGTSTHGTTGTQDTKDITGTESADSVSDIEPSLTVEGTELGLGQQSAVQSAEPSAMLYTQSHASTGRESHSQADEDFQVKREVASPILQEGWKETLHEN